MGACAGQVPSDATARARVKQLATEFVFNGLYGAGQSWPSYVASLGRPGQIQRLADRQEVSDMVISKELPSQCIPSEEVQTDLRSDLFRAGSKCFLKHHRKTPLTDNGRGYSGMSGLDTHEPSGSNPIRKKTSSRGSAL
jgi:hypothetical protein